MSKVIHGFRRIPGISSSVITIGKFDGVHRGHQKLIGHVVRSARRKKAVSIVITFRRRYEDTHFAHPLPRLYSLSDNIDRLSALGPDYIVVIDFSPEFVILSAREFFQKLIDYYRINEIAIGEDFHFGRGKEGTPAVMKCFAKDALRDYRRRIDVKVFPFLRYRNRKVATSAVREAVAEGDCRSAQVMLGDFFSCSGTVAKGKRLGRTIGFPTANISAGGMLPRAGVYLSFVRIGGVAAKPALTFIGKAAFHGAAVQCESHLLDFSNNLYGKRIQIFFVRYLRPVRKISSVDALKELIASDVRNARRIFARSTQWLLKQRRRPK